MTYFMEKLLHLSCFFAVYLLPTIVPNFACIIFCSPLCPSV